MDKNVPLVVVRRLPRYYRYLSDLEEMGIERVSSQVLSKKLGFTASQVRQDLNCFGGFGQQGYGYNVNSGMVFSEKFGSRQRFHMIITDAEIPSTPLLERSVCDKCRKCADACPLGAISKTETKIVEICGKKMEIAVIDYEKCKICKNGAIPNRFTSAGAPDRVAALCNRTCMCHLEEAGLIGNLFDNPFRQREAWAIDEEGRSKSRDTDSANVLGGAFSKDGKRGH